MYLGPFDLQVRSERKKEKMSRIMENRNVDFSKMLTLSWVGHESGHDGYEQRWIKWGCSENSISKIFPEHFYEKAWFWAAEAITLIPILCYHKEEIWKERISQVAEKERISMALENGWALEPAVPFWTDGAVKGEAVWQSPNVWTYIQLIKANAWRARMTLKCFSKKVVE